MCPVCNKEVLTVVPKVPTLTEKIYMELRNRILNGEILPGDSLREEDLAMRMSTSRTPVRTALKMLLSEGFLCQGGNRSLRVATISPKELHDTFAARRAVEGEIAELACFRATAESLVRLEHFVLDEQAAHRERNRLLTLTADRRFHAYLAEMADNDILQDFQERLGNRVSLYLALSSTLEDEVSYALDEHGRLVEAIRSGDLRHARDTMLDHLRNIEARIFRRLESEENRSGPGGPGRGEKGRLM